jgi:hypothetical protein
MPGLPVVMYKGDVALRSVGPTSDALLQALAALYGAEARAGKMREETAFTGISMAGEPASLDKGPVKLKLFFEREAEDRYAELYLNIDAAKKELWLNEKDTDYRRAILSALRQE